MSGRGRESCVAAGLLAVVLAMPGVAAAQSAFQPLTGNAVPQGSPIPRVLPPTPPSVAPGLEVPPATEAPLPGGDQAVAVRAVAVEGATAFSARRFDAVTAGLIGPATTLSRIEAARLALLNLYRADGYAFTAVNAALAAETGRLRFTVVEGRIADVKLEGDIGPAGVQVLRFLRHLTETRPINTATLERWLLLAQDVPGVTVHAVLRPSTDDPGALTLIAQVSRQVADGLLTADNRAFPLTGPEEVLGVLDANSFTQLGERTEVSIYHTNGNTQNFGQVSEEVFLGGSGLKLRVYGGYGQATPSDPLRSIGYKGFTTLIGAALTYPVIRQRQQTLNLGINFDVVETEVRDEAVPGGVTVRASRDSLRVGRVGADYALQDLVLGGDRGAVNLVSLRVSHGFPGLGGTGDDNPTPGRVGERADFTKLSFDLSRTQTLFQPWAGATVALRGRVLGQVTGDILPPAEQFFFGGPEFNRGFYAGEVTADTALSWTVEAQLNWAFEAPLLGRVWSVTAQTYAFYDRGEAWQNQRGAADERLSSEGIGGRFFLTRYTEFDVEGVIRNTRLPLGLPGIVRPIKADAAYWRVLTRF